MRCRANSERELKADKTRRLAGFVFVVAAAVAIDGKLQQFLPLACAKLVAYQPCPVGISGHLFYGKS
ncbi:MAG: hypothetical protein EA348_08665 [Pseudomonadaceae bacterium]|nr:MAG: hypothetical protein EA348_08665 [Pseudomonadaceae bacterium]